MRSCRNRRISKNPRNNNKNKTNNRQRKKQNLHCKRQIKGFNFFPLDLAGRHKQKHPSGIFFIIWNTNISDFVLEKMFNTSGGEMSKCKFIWPNIFHCIRESLLGRSSSLFIVLLEFLPLCFLGRTSIDHLCAKHTGAYKHFSFAL